MTPLLAPDPAVRDLVVDAALGTATLLDESHRVGPRSITGSVFGKWPPRCARRAGVAASCGHAHGSRPGERVQYQILPIRALKR